MGIQRRTNGSITVLQVEGDLYGGDETDRLREAVRAEAAGGHMQLLLNMTECPRLNSAGLSALVEAHQYYAARHGDLKMCGLNERLRPLLQTTRLLSVFDLYPNEAEALAAFAARPV